MDYIASAKNLIKDIISIAKREGKISGFCIGNTAKQEVHSLYFTPLRNTPRMVIGGAIVYSERQAMTLAKIADGKADYVLVDAEKKIPDEDSLTGEPANIERAVRETIKKSSLWVYKGNDIAVEAVDYLLSYITKDSLRGLGAKRIAILGAGNIGIKLALKFVERGASVTLARRDKEKLNVIVKALNYAKPIYTTAKVSGQADNNKAALNADILIGVTSGMPVITAGIVKNLANKAVIIDVGKGTLYRNAIAAAEVLKMPIYRLDVSASFEGMIEHLFSIESLFNNRLGRALYEGIPLVSGGLLGYSGEIVVDNYRSPSIIYGIANGCGDFIRKPSQKQIVLLKKLKDLTNKNWGN